MTDKPAFLTRGICLGYRLSRGFDYPDDDLTFMRRTRGMLAGLYAHVRSSAWDLAPEMQRELNRISHGEGGGSRASMIGLFVARRVHARGNVELHNYDDVIVFPGNIEILEDNG